jgi:hypothetical protein
MPTDPQPETDTTERPSVVTLRASFSWLARAHWEAVLRKAGIQFATATDGRQSVFLAAVPRELASGVHYLALETHPEPDGDDGGAHWIFEWQPAPSDAPPEWMRISSNAVGGYPSVLERLAEAAGSENAPLSMRSSATFAIDPDQWTPIYAPQHLYSRQTTLHADGEKTITFSESSLAWTVTPPVSGVDKVTCTTLWSERRGSQVLLQVRGTVLATISGTLQSTLEDALWAGARTFLNRAAEK